MKTKSLINTNPFLKNATKRKLLVARSVRTSSAVEGIKPSQGKVFEITKRKNKKIYKTAKRTARKAS